MEVSNGGVVTFAPNLEQNGQGYAAIGKNFVNREVTAIKGLGKGTAIALGSVLGGVLGGAAVVSLGGLYGAGVMIWHTGGTLFAPAAAVVNATTHTYSLLPDTVRGPVANVGDRLVSLKDVVVNSSPVQSILVKPASRAASFCGKTAAAAYDLTWEKMGKMLPLGEGDFVARAQKPDSYPERQPVEVVPWSYPWAGYKPAYYDAPEVLKLDGERMEVERKVAESLLESYPELKAMLTVEDLLRPSVQVNRDSCEGNIAFDEKGYPLNPKGRTGLAGRGVLAEWGPNSVAAPMVTRDNPETGDLEVLLVKNPEDGRWTLPAGLLKNEEALGQAMSRVLAEQTGVTFRCNHGTVLSREYQKHPENTDNAWREKTTAHRHLNRSEARRDAQPVAPGAQWVNLNDIRVSLRDFRFDAFKALQTIALPKH